MQRLNRVSVNLLSEALPTLQEMINLLKSSFEGGQFAMALGVIDAFEMLAVSPLWGRSPMIEVEAVKNKYRHAEC